MPSMTIKDILDNKTKPDKRLVKDFKELAGVVKVLKAQGYSIVLTQGVWDLIHEGHALYLEDAKKQGDILIVGVDSDEMTRKRKGPDRPIVPQEERVRMISHLRHVDIIAIRNSKDGLGKLIDVVRPDVLVVSKSTNDFTDKMKNEYKGLCGKIINLPPRATTHTSARIRRLAIDGAEKLASQITKLTSDFLNKIKNEA